MLKLRYRIVAVPGGLATLLPNDTCETRKGAAAAPPRRHAGGTRFSMPRARGGTGEQAKAGRWQPDQNIWPPTPLVADGVLCVHLLPPHPGCVPLSVRQGGRKRRGRQTACGLTYAHVGLQDHADVICAVTNG